ncbi:unnamed protein product [marine sediment metagenome]|uniref:Uncharacterized protein n=1 Tax=marine sediment metagenome TaxID=412755 RepID=X0TL44_9ZZZZ
MQYKTMYAIVDKTTRKILGFDWLECGDEIPLMAETESEMVTVLCGFSFPNMGNEIDKFNNAEVVSVLLLWS